MKKTNSAAVHNPEPKRVMPSSGTALSRQPSPGLDGGTLSRVGAAADRLTEAEALPASEVAQYARESGDHKGASGILTGNPQEMQWSLIQRLGRITEEPGPPPDDPRLRGYSLADYADLVIPDTNRLLNDYYLERGSIMFYVGSSGMGKSSSLAQMVISLTIGRDVFGLEPARALKILMLQSEDSDRDLKMMAEGVLAGLKLTLEDYDLHRANCRAETVDWASGGNLLLEVVLPLLDSYRPDIIVLNPFNAYLGADNKNAEKVSWFLREMLNPLLHTFGCAAIIVHHTPKTNFQNRDDWGHNDHMYGGAGAADITNAARAILNIEATRDPGVFRFRGSKRGRNLGWVDDKGKSTTEQYFAYASKYDTTAGMYWVPAKKEDIRQSNRGKSDKPTPYDRVLAATEYLANAKTEGSRYSSVIVSKLCERFSCAVRTARTALGECVEHGFADATKDGKNAVYTVTALGLAKLKSSTPTHRLEDTEPEMVVPDRPGRSNFQRAKEAVE